MPRTVDVLSDVLETFRLRSTVFTRAELRPPWGLSAEGQDHFAFHIVSRGHAWLDAGDGTATEVNAGDVVVLAPGRAHALRDEPSSVARPFQELIREGLFGRRLTPVEPDATHLVCGCFKFDEGGDVLLAALPPVVHSRNVAGGDVGPWLAQTIELLAHESLADRPGSETVVNRLADALFVYILRSHLAQVAPGETSWLRGLVDAQIGPSLRAIHSSPDTAWTVASLATHVAMSRSAFAARFTTVVGETPMQYLTRWRLRKAAGLLRTGRAAIAEVAAKVGYESEAAFHKAFKRTIGVAPGAYRRAAREAVA